MGDHREGEGETQRNKGRIFVTQALRGEGWKEERMVGGGGGEDLRSLGLLSLGSSRPKQKQGYPFPENTESRIVKYTRENTQQRSGWRM